MRQRKFVLRSYIPPPPSKVFFQYFLCILFDFKKEMSLLKANIYIDRLDDKKFATFANNFGKMMR